MLSREPERGSGAVVEGTNANSGHGLAHGRRRTAAAVRSSHVERRGRAAALSWRAGSHERDGGEARVIGGNEVVGVSARVSLERVADVVDLTQLTGALEYTAARDQTTPNHVHRQHLHTHTHAHTDGPAPHHTIHITGDTCTVKKTNERVLNNCKEETVRHRQSKEASILRSDHEETRELPGERDNARNNARCTQARKATHGLDGQHQDVEESIRMTVDRDKWRKYVHGVANPRIEDG